jgi:alpha-mannosidase
VENPELAPAPVSQVKAWANGISNEFFKVEAVCGETGIKITRNGENVLAANGIEFATFRDVWGSWGAMDEDPAGFRCDKRLETLRITEVRAIENGPERASLFTVLKGASSQIRIRFDLYRGADSVSCSAQIIWQDREARLRMVMDPAESVTYGIPGGEIVRSTYGDVPGGRWLKINGYGIASDNFCGFTALEDLYSVNLVRGCRSASDEPASDWKNSERAITDYGSHEYKFMITGPGKDVKEAAEEIKLPLINMMLWTHE